MAGENALLTVSKYGARRIRVMAIEHGITVVADEDRGPNRKAMYTRKITSDSFMVMTASTSFQASDDFSKWLRNYLRRITGPGADLGPMRVQVWDRGVDKQGRVVPFDKTGVLTSAVTFGDVFNSTVYPLALAFDGATDPVDIESELLSRFRLPTARGENPNSDPDLFYPAGTQLSGNLGVEAALYDLVSDDEVRRLTQRYGVNPVGPGGTIVPGGLRASGA